MVLRRDAVCLENNIFIIVGNMRAEFIQPDDSRWKEFLTKAAHDFYHLSEYTSFAARHEGGQAVAFWAEEEGAGLLVPLLIRPLPEKLDAQIDGCDALSPYGYPAPILYGSPDEITTGRLMQQFVDLGKERGLVSVFVRMHPLLPFPKEPLRQLGLLVQHGQTVCCDLNSSADEMLKQTCQNHKRNIRKLQRNGFTTVRNDWSFWYQFMDVYRDTMRRVGAKEFYLFSDNYFDDLRGTLEDKLDLWVVLSPNGEFAAGGVFTVINGIIEYHLGGTAEHFLGVAPSKLMFSDVRNWGKEAGYRVLHLGGGLGGEADSLFQFKAGFSQNYADFCTCRMVLDQAKYDRLEKMWRKLSGQERQDQEAFPVYRQGI